MSAENKSIREYVYYSDQKITDLAQQLPPPSGSRRDRISAVGFSTPVGGGNFALEPREPEPILRTMQRVWQHLNNEHLIGTFDEPKQYFYGQLEFYYGLFDTVNPPVLFLVGATERTIVALGGSMKHEHGHRGQEIGAAENAQNVTLEPDVAAIIHTKSEANPTATPSKMQGSAPGEDSWAIHVAGMYLNWQGWQGKRMEFEVLARKDAPRSRVSQPYFDSPRDVLIGSPIFVALI